MSEPKSKVYPADVAIISVPSGRFYCRIGATKKGLPDVYVGSWHPNREAALREAASWLEDHGYVHPMTHNV